MHPDLWFHLRLPEFDEASLGAGGREIWGEVCFLPSAHRTSPRAGEHPEWARSDLF